MKYKKNILNVVSYKFANQYKICLINISQLGVPNCFALISQQIFKQFYADTSRYD